MLKAVITTYLNHAPTTSLHLLIKGVNTRPLGSSFRLVRQVHVAHAKAPRTKSHMKHAPLGACLPGKFWISDLLRSFLVQSWDEIARVGEPAAKPSHCPLCLKLLPLAEFKGVAPLRSLAGCVIVIFEPNYRAKRFHICRSKLLSHIDVDSCYRHGVQVFPAHPESAPRLAPFYFVLYFVGWCVKLWSGGRRTCHTYSYGPGYCYYYVSLQGEPQKVFVRGEGILDFLPSQQTEISPLTTQPQMQAELIRSPVRGQE